MEGGGELVGLGTQERHVDGRRCLVGVFDLEFGER